MSAFPVDDAREIASSSLPVSSRTSAVVMSSPAGVRYPPGSVTCVSEGDITFTSFSSGFSTVACSNSLFANAGLTAALIVFVILVL